MPEEKFINQQGTSRQEIEIKRNAETLKLCMSFVMDGHLKRDY